MEATTRQLPSIRIWSGVARAYDLTCLHAFARTPPYGTATAEPITRAEPQARAMQCEEAGISESAIHGGAAARPGDREHGIQESRRGPARPPGAWSPPGGPARIRTHSSAGDGMPQ